MSKTPDTDINGKQASKTKAAFETPDNCGEVNFLSDVSEVENKTIARRATMAFSMWWSMFLREQDPIPTDRT